jgi:hypothetical protein
MVVSKRSLSKWFAAYMLLVATVVRGDKSSCSAEGTCETLLDDFTCGLPAALCIDSPNSKDIYRHGGSAQAYKSDQPEKGYICDPELYTEVSSHRVATWPYWISTRKSPPRLRVTLKLWSCSMPENDSAIGDTCCCHPLDDKNDWIDPTVVHVWQASPIGRYSSLREGEADGDCRARQKYDPRSGDVSFETVTPGSTGSLGGLGPGGWDVPPYGPPVLHVLVANSLHAPTLIHVPILMQRKTLGPQSFHGVDWRGAAWMQNKEKYQAFNVSSWNAEPMKNRIELKVDVYLQARKNKKSIHLSDELCRSWVYGLPASFFLEPISECAPSMLDFFAL